MDQGKIKDSVKRAFDQLAEKCASGEFSKLQDKVGSPALANWILAKKGKGKKSKFKAKPKA